MHTSLTPASNLLREQGGLPSPMGEILPAKHDFLKIGFTARPEIFGTVPISKSNHMPRMNIFLEFVVVEHKCLFFVFGKNLTN